jgi:hypothetical protein
MTMSAALAARQASLCPHLGHPPCFSIQLTGRKARAGGLWRSMVGPFSGPPTNQCKWSMVGPNAAYVKRRLPSPLDEERHPGKEERYEQHPTGTSH